MRSFRLSLLFPILAVFTCLAQTPVEQVIAEALKPSALDNNLERLTDRIGGRVPGTPAMEKAVQWGIEVFKVAGADGVHTESFSIPASWAEGATSMTIVAPEQFKVRAISLAWAPALAPQRHVPIIDVGEGNAEDFAKAGSVAGAIVLVHSEEMHTWADLFGEYMRVPVTIDLAVKGKAIAIALQSTRPHDLLYRHSNSPEGGIDRLPGIQVAREDAARISRLLASGQKLYADISVPNRVGGATTTSNVIAELRGRQDEKPDEYVVLGAHLDSWELGTGALDNGCNAALVVDALRAIQASGQRPRRSIRFILFSGEEQGLVGSHAYVTAHRSEMDKVAAMVVLDAGIGKVTGFSLGGRKDVLDAVNELATPLKQFDAANMTTDATYGTDNFDFLLEGVPTLMANQVEENYLINYHAMSDTFDKVDLARLKQHVAEAAAITFAIADAPQRVGPRLTHDQIAQTLSETHLDDQMKGFGVWDDWATGKRGRQK